MAMGGTDMGDFRMIPSGMGLMVPAHTPWQAMEFAFVFVMWTVMMVGMMTPSATPMILMYARVGRHTAPQGTPFAATVWFAAGYFVAWLAFALLATLVQWALERTVLLDSWMASTSNVLGGFLFVVAGTYQWTRLRLRSPENPARVMLQLDNTLIDLIYFRQTRSNCRPEKELDGPQRSLSLIRQSFVLT
jgi:predicted metal-binding membrane protein